VKPFVDRCGDSAIADIKTADIQDFIANLQRPRILGRRLSSNLGTPSGGTQGFEPASAKRRRRAARRERILADQPTNETRRVE
jgi:hypothetical protein